MDLCNARRDANKKLQCYDVKGKKTGCDDILQVCEYKKVDDKREPKGCAFVKEQVANVRNEAK